MLGDILLGVVGVVGLLLLRVLEWGENLLLVLRRRRLLSKRRHKHVHAPDRPTDFAERR
jgi:hypothetical protein